MRDMGRHRYRHTGAILSASDIRASGAAAEAAAERKMAKYGQLAQSYTFIPVAFETLGPINNAGLEFLSDLGRRISQESNDHRESAVLFQRLSVLIQRFNAVAIQGTFAHTPTEDCLLYTSPSPRDS